MGWRRRQRAVRRRTSGDESPIVSRRLLRPGPTRANVRELGDVGLWSRRRPDGEGRVGRVHLDPAPVGDVAPCRCLHDLIWNVGAEPAEVIGPPTPPSFAHLEQSREPVMSRTPLRGCARHPGRPRSPRRRTSQRPQRRRVPASTEPPLPVHAFIAAARVAPGTVRARIDRWGRPGASGNARVITFKNREINSALLLWNPLQGGCGRRGLAVDAHCRPTGWRSFPRRSRWPSPRAYGHQGPARWANADVRDPFR